MYHSIPPPPPHIPLNLLPLSPAHTTQSAPPPPPSPPLHLHTLLNLPPPLPPLSPAHTTQSAPQPQPLHTHSPLSPLPPARTPLNLPPHHLHTHTHTPFDLPPHPSSLLSLSVTWGELQFSLGKTFPPSSAMAASTSCKNPVQSGIWNTATDQHLSKDRSGNSQQSHGLILLLITTHVRYTTIKQCMNCLWSIHAGLPYYYIHSAQLYQLHSGWKIHRLCALDYKDGYKSIPVQFMMVMVMRLEKPILIVVYSCCIALM